MHHSKFGGQCLSWGHKHRPLSVPEPPERRARDLAMFNLAIDSKLRGCDVVAMKVEDAAPSGYPLARATVRERKTGRPVRFELTEQTRQAVDDYLKATGKVPGEFLFTSRRRVGEAMTTRQYARLVAEWITGIGLDPHIFATHSLRRTKATLIYRRTGNLRAGNKNPSFDHLVGGDEQRCWTGSL